LTIEEKPTPHSASSVSSLLSSTYNIICLIQERHCPITVPQKQGIRDRNGKECPWVGFLLYPYPTLYLPGKKIRYPYPIHQFMIQMYIYLRLGLGRVWQYMYPIHCQSGKVTIQKKITLSCQVSIHQVQDKLPSLIRDLHFYMK